MKLKYLGEHTRIRKHGVKVDVKNGEVVELDEKYAQHLLKVYKNSWEEAAEKKKVKKVKETKSEE